MLELRAKNVEQVIGRVRACFCLSGHASVGDDGPQWRHATTSANSVSGWCIVAGQ